MQEKINIKPITLKELGEFTEQVILPGVEEMIKPLENKVDKLEAKIDQGFSEMRKGFSEVGRAIQVLSGDVAELKVQKEEERHEERIRFLERKAAVK